MFCFLYFILFFSLVSSFHNFWWCIFKITEIFLSCIQYIDGLIKGIFYFYCSIYDFLLFFSKVSISLFILPIYSHRSTFFYLTLAYQSELLETANLIVPKSLSYLSLVLIPAVSLQTLFACSHAFCWWEMMCWVKRNDVNRTLVWGFTSSGWGFGCVNFLLYPWWQWLKFPLVSLFLPRVPLDLSRV